MTRTVELEVARATLSELMAGLTVDDEVEIIHNRKPVARIVLPGPFEEFVHSALDGM